MKNREIKFRGKMGQTGEWVYGYFVKAPFESFRIYLQPFSEASSNTYYSVIPETVGEFTGLKDKNGKEICEGDILFGREEGNGETTAWTDVYYIVFYDKKSASFKIREKNINEDSVWCDSVSEINKEYEVIGNIHENAGLLAVAP